MNMLRQGAVQEAASAAGGEVPQDGDGEWRSEEYEESTESRFAESPERGQTILDSFWQLPQTSLSHNSGTPNQCNASVECHDEVS